VARLVHYTVHHREVAILQLHANQNEVNAGQKLRLKLSLKQISEDDLHRHEYHEDLLRYKVLTSQGHLGRNAFAHRAFTKHKTMLDTTSIGEVSLL
jgi:hypothetical protein